MVATFTMGIVFPFANQKGAISGAITGCLFGWLIFFGSKTDPKSQFLKSAVPPTINMTECRNEQWIVDIKEHTKLEEWVKNFDIPQIYYGVVKIPDMLKMRFSRHYAKISYFQ